MLFLLTFKIIIYSATRDYFVMKDCADLVFLQLLNLGYILM